MSIIIKISLSNKDWRIIELRGEYFLQSNEFLTKEEWQTQDRGSLGVLLVNLGGLVERHEI